MLAMKQKKPALSADSPSAEYLTGSHKEPEAFELNNEPDIIDQFALESDMVQSSANTQTLQNELYLPIENPEAPEAQPQLEFTGIETVSYNTLTQPTTSRTEM